MDNFQALIRHRNDEAVRLRAAAAQRAAVRDATRGAFGAGFAPKAALARVLRDAAERLDPGPRTVRPRSA